MSCIPGSIMHAHKKKKKTPIWRPAICGLGQFRLCRSQDGSLRSPRVAFALELELELENYYTWPITAGHGLIKDVVSLLRIVHAGNHVRATVSSDPVVQRS